MKITDEAVEAANIAYRAERRSHIQSLRKALEAAAPHMLPEPTGDAA